MAAYHRNLLDALREMDGWPDRDLVVKDESGLP